MKSKIIMGFRIIESNIGRLYILKRRGAYCLSKFQRLASLDDMLSINNLYWFATIEEIENLLNNSQSIISD